MKHEVNQISDFLPINATQQRPVALSTLTPAELKEYLEGAHKFVDEWNKENPDGLTLKLPIERLNIVPNQAGRVSIVVGPSPNYNSGAFTYPVSVANSIAIRLGLPSFAALASTIQSTANTPSHIEFTIKLVKKGDLYLRTDGTQAAYKGPGTTIVGQEAIKLSPAALKRIGELTAEVDRAEMLSMRKHINSLGQAASAPAAAGGVDDDETMGG